MCLSCQPVGFYPKLPLFRLVIEKKKVNDFIRSKEKLANSNVSFYFKLPRAPPEDFRLKWGASPPFTSSLNRPMIRNSDQITIVMTIMTPPLHKSVQLSITRSNIWLANWTMFKIIFDHLHFGQWLSGESKSIPNIFHWFDQIVYIH